MSISQTLNKASSGSPYSTSSSLPAQTGRDVRKPSPADSTSSTESSDKSADHDSGYSSGGQAIAARAAAPAWDAATGRPIVQPVQSSPAKVGTPLSAQRPSFSARGSLPDLGFAGFHIGSPQSISNSTLSGSHQNNMFHVGSAGTAKGHNMFGASPYSSRLGLPQSSVRSSSGFHGAIEEDDDEDALDDDDEMNDQRDSYPARKVSGGHGTRGLSLDGEPAKTSQDVADMEWEANDMEL